MEPRCICTWYLKSDFEISKKSEINFGGYNFIFYVFTKSFHEVSTFFVTCIKKTKRCHENRLILASKFVFFYIYHKNVGFSRNDFVNIYDVKIYARTFFYNYFDISMSKIIYKYRVHLHPGAKTPSPLRSFFLSFFLKRTICRRVFVKIASSFGHFQLKF